MKQACFQIKGASPALFVFDKPSPKRALIEFSAGVEPIRSFGIYASLRVSLGIKMEGCEEDGYTPIVRKAL